MEDNKSNEFEDSKDFTCSHCGRKIKDNVAVRGFSVICPYCGMPL